MWYMINVYLRLGIRTPVYIVIYTGALSPIKYNNNNNNSNSNNSNRRKNSYWKFNWGIFESLK
jgi:hypothetical protein